MPDFRTHKRSKIGPALEHLRYNFWLTNGIRLMLKLLGIDINLQRNHCRVYQRSFQIDGKGKNFIRFIVLNFDFTTKK